MKDKDWGILLIIVNERLREVGREGVQGLCVSVGFEVLLRGLVFRIRILLISQPHLFRDVLWKGEIDDLRFEKKSEK